MDVITRNHVTISGAREPTLVFAHGFGCDQTVWRQVVPRLESRHRIVLFDYVGSGRSARQAYDPERYASLDGYATDVLEVCDALNLVCPIFIGHSMSGMIAVGALRKCPSLFDRVVMIGASPRYLNDPTYFGGFEQRDIESYLDLMDRNFLGWSSSFAQTATKDPTVSAELASRFTRGDPRWLRQQARAIFFSDFRADLPEIDTPTLIIQSLSDDIVPRAVGEYLQASLRRSRLHIVDAPGHMPHLTDPAMISDIIAEYCALPRGELL